jgi:hypothetical protein
MIHDSVNRITRSIQKIEQAASMVPALRSPESAPVTGTEARSGGAGLPPGPGGPSQGSGRAAPALSRSYTLDELRELCRANDLPTQGIASECVTRLQDAGISL